MKNIILFGSALVFLIWLLYFGLPLDFMIKYPVFIALVGCILICITSVGLVSTIIGYSRRNNPDAQPKDGEGYLIFAVILLSLFGSGISLIYKSSNLESAEFTDNGTFTTGIVVSGKVLKTRRSDFSSLTVKYTVDGKEYLESTDMPASVVENFGIGQEVPIAYSKRNPKIFKVLNSSADVSSYTKKTEKQIQLIDLEKVLAMKTADEAVNYLNSFNQKWTAEAGDVEKSVVYKNNIKNSMIKVIGEEELNFATTENFMTEAHSEIEKLGFKALENVPVEGKSYENKEYILNIKRQRPEFNTQNAQDRFETFTIITLLKK